MKAEELMIGDWVNLYDRLLKINIDDLCFIEREEVYCKPILLTEEILEKNSFLKVEFIEYPSHSVGVSFLYRNTSEGLRIFVQNACDYGYWFAYRSNNEYICTCDFVHELQHLLKLCGIEKEIVL